MLGIAGIYRYLGRILSYESYEITKVETKIPLSVCSYRYTATDRWWLYGGLMWAGSCGGFWKAVTVSGERKKCTDTGVCILTATR